MNRFRLRRPSMYYIAGKKQTGNIQMTKGCYMLSSEESRIPPIITFLKLLTLAISIGTGGPFGAEGPYIATGGVFGSLTDQVIHNIFRRPENHSHCRGLRRNWHRQY